MVVRHSIIYLIGVQSGKNLSKNPQRHVNIRKSAFSMK